jgi:putative glycerol-1-phosphate prenyltransferase
MAIDIIAQWRHVFKLDPDRELDDAALERLCTSGTDGILIGGSSGLTYANTERLLRRVRGYGLPCVLEVSSIEALVPGFDLYFIPVALNAADADWIVGLHQEAIAELARRGEQVPWERSAAEGYVILNPASTVARITRARTNLTAADVAAYARMAEHLFRMPIFYVEYSGAFGDMAMLAAAREALTRTRLFYGGGIDGPERASEAAALADTIVVGNIIYDDLERALATVRVKSMRKGTDTDE